MDGRDVKIRRTQGSRWTREQIEWVRRRHERGDSADEIARDMGIHATTLKATVRKYAITFSTRPYMPRVARTEDGMRFRLAREAAGLTPSQAAKAMGFSTKTIYDLECGSKAPRIDTLQRAAKAYHVRAGWLLEGLGKEIVSGS